MTQRFSIYALALFGLIAAGCRSKPELKLYEPGDTQVWRTADQRAISESGDNPKVAFETSKGTFIVELFPDEAPITVENFLEYVDSGFYEGTIFHRVIPGFMVQGGGLTVDLEKKETREAIQNEAGNGLRNQRGTLAMARTSQLDSATAQFFVNVVNNPFLNGDGETDGYAVFGRIYEGMSVIDEIALVPTESRQGGSDVPINPVIIQEVRRVNEAP